MSDRLGGSRERLGIETLVSRSVVKERGDKMIKQSYKYFCEVCHKITEHQDTKTDGVVKMKCKECGCYH